MAFNSIRQCPSIPKSYPILILGQQLQLIQSLSCDDWLQSCRAYFTGLSYCQGYFSPMKQEAILPLNLNSVCFTITLTFGYKFK